MDTPHQKLKENKVFQEDFKQLKYPMFNITEEADNKAKMNTNKKKVKFHEIIKAPYKYYHKNKFSGELNEEEISSNHTSSKQLPNIHNHYGIETSQKKFEIKFKLRDDDPDFCGGPGDKLLPRQTKFGKQKY